MVPTTSLLAYNLSFVPSMKWEEKIGLSSSHTSSEKQTICANCIASLGPQFPKGSHKLYFPPKEILSWLQKD